MMNKSAKFHKDSPSVKKSAKKSKMTKNSNQGEYAGGSALNSSLTLPLEVLPGTNCAFSDNKTTETLERAPCARDRRKSRSLQLARSS